MEYRYIRRPTDPEKILHSLIRGLDGLWQM